MNEYRTYKLQRLRRQVQRGEYRVNETAIADAIVRRVWGRDALPEPDLAPPATLAPRRTAWATSLAVETVSADPRGEPTLVAR
jgi:hypothetical protein